MNVTLVLVILNVAVFVWQYASGTHFNDSASLVEHGALYGAYVTQRGEWWRVVTGGFEHGGFTHLAFNMFALWQLGRYLEVTIGSPRMLAVYLFSLAVSGAAVIEFASRDVTVGASGAIYGLFGALLAIGVRLGKRGRQMIAQIVPVLLINLAFTFADPFISRAGHLGGLAAGFIAGYLLYIVERPSGVAVAVRDAAGVAADAELLPPDPQPRRS